MACLFENSDGFSSPKHYINRITSEAITTWNNKQWIKRGEMKGSWLNYLNPNFL